jgi:hypothetical protein
MAGIKFVINERKDIEMKVNPPPGDHNKTPGRRTRVFSDDVDRNSSSSVAK